MSLNDEKRLEEIYKESVAERTDIFLLDADPLTFDWNYFYQRFHWLEGCYGEIYESFEIISSTEDQSKYRITLTNSKTFDVAVNKPNKKKLKSIIYTSLCNNIANSSIKELNEFVDKLPDNQHAFHVVFQDENQQMNVTGKVKMYAYSLYQGIRNCILDSIRKQGIRPEVLYFEIEKNDPGLKKLNTYKSFFRGSVPWLNREFIDNNIDPQVVRVFFWNSNL